MLAGDWHIPPAALSPFKTHQSLASSLLGCSSCPISPETKEQFTLPGETGSSLLSQATADLNWSWRTDYWDGGWNPRCQTEEIVVPTLLYVILFSNSVNSAAERKKWLEQKGKVEKLNLQIDSRCSDPSTEIKTWKIKIACLLQKCPSPVGMIPNENILEECPDRVLKND